MINYDMPVTLAQDLFLSLEGESLRQGEPTLFLRTQRCNCLCKSDIYPNCKCDSLYSLKDSETTVHTTVGKILKKIETFNCRNISITGGEPLLHMKELCNILEGLKGYDVTIETNGSLPIKEIIEKYGDYVRIIGDWKMPGFAGERTNKMMLWQNLLWYRGKDALKFVVTKEDLPLLKKFVEETRIDQKTNCFVSPAWGAVELKDVVQFIVDNRDYRLRLSLQIHKLFNATGEDLLRASQSSIDDIYL